MMRYGIPSYRLPEDVLDREIGTLLETGIVFSPNQTLGVDFTLEGLRRDGFDAVFLGTGAQRSRRIALQGGDLPDVMWGMEFLNRVAAGEEINLRENVMVIGGGNVAVDVALTARRSGAVNVFMACLECLEEMPAHDREIQRALREGVRLLPSRGPEKILGRDGKVTGIDLVACTSVFDEKGNFCPRFDDSSRECILVDQVIMAVGQAADLSFLAEDSDVKTADGLIVVDRDSLETGMNGVYAGGDAVRMPGAVIHAIAAGRRAAASIDRRLGGSGDIEEVLFDRPEPKPVLGREDGFASKPRIAEAEIPLEQRHDFKEVVVGYDAGQAAAEAARCLQCDLRLTLGCNPPPPQHIMAFTRENIERAPEGEGVYRLFDEDRNVLVIKGTASLRRDLLNQREDNGRAVWFEYEEDKMYSKRESELIQRYLQEHGEMPGGDDDDLF